MKIAVYAEHHSRAGQVCHDEELIERESDDLWVIEEDTEAELISAAQVMLEQQDPRPGGAGQAYNHRVARNILDYLGVEHD